MDGKVLAAPCIAEQLVVYDVATEAVRGVGISAAAKGEWRLVGICAVDSKVVAAPCHVENLPVYAVATE